MYLKSQSDFTIWNRGSNAVTLSIFNPWLMFLLHIHILSKAADNNFIIGPLQDHP